MTKDLNKGDLVVIKEDNFIMADCLLFCFYSTSGNCFIDTKSLDGEVSLKPKY